VCSVGLCIVEVFIALNRLSRSKIRAIANSIAQVIYYRKHFVEKYFQHRVPYLESHNLQNPVNPFLKISCKSSKVTEESRKHRLDWVQNEKTRDN